MHIYTILFYIYILKIRFIKNPYLFSSLNLIFYFIEHLT